MLAVTGVTSFAETLGTAGGEVNTFCAEDRGLLKNVNESLIAHIEIETLCVADQLRVLQYSMRIEVY